MSSPRSQPIAATSPLDAVLAALTEGPALCVFDLDSTILDNRPRQALILREFGEARGEAALAQVSPEHFNGWDLETAMRNAGVAAPRAKELTPDARRFWKERFFTSRYCRHDRPVRGAVDFVNAVDRLATVVYLTGRHTEMESGTLEALGHAGFPLPGPRVQLILKPRQDLHDDVWKEEACVRLRAMGKVAAAFDNEPAHINRYRQAFPEALCVHLATDHSGRPIPLAAGISSIPNFLR